MNPLDWNRQHQVAGIAFCAIGAIVGNFFRLDGLPIPTVVFAFHFRSVGRYNRCFPALAVARRSLWAVARYRRMRRGIGILRSIYNYRGADLRPSPQALTCIPR
jgi:hypothetical protein